MAGLLQPPNGEKSENYNDIVPGCLLVGIVIGAIKACTCMAIGAYRRVVIVVSVLMQQQAAH
jgi:hypothetical protein